MIGIQKLRISTRAIRELNVFHQQGDALNEDFEFLVAGSFDRGGRRWEAVGEVPFDHLENVGSLLEMYVANTACELDTKEVMLLAFVLDLPTTQRNFSNTLDWNRQKVVITHDPCRMA